jgi:hypothetical protein
MRFHKECLESPCTDYFYLEGVRVNSECKGHQNWLPRISKNEFSVQRFLKCSLFHCSLFHCVGKCVLED